MKEVTMSPMLRVSTDCPVYAVSTRRSGKDLWKIARIKMLSYKTQRNLAKGYRPNRKLSVVCDDVTRILRSQTNRRELRRLKYGSSIQGLFFQLVDECLDFFVKFVESLQTPGKHAPWFTLCMISIYVAIFAFMASEWTIVSEGNTWTFGPHNLARYVRSTSRITSFSSEFLVAWGAFDLRQIVLQGESFRWFTSPFLHVNIVHCMSNIFMYILFGTVVERTYGPILSAIVWFMAALMGSFMAGACGKPCTVLVGASGAVFGYFGFFCMDTWLRWNVIKRPIIRVLFVLMFTAQSIYTVVTDANVSTWAHVGGCIGGVCCSVILVKRIQSIHKRRIFWTVVATCIVIMFFIFPLVVYETAPRYESCA